MCINDEAERACVFAFPPRPKIPSNRPYVLRIFRDSIEARRRRWKYECCWRSDIRREQKWFSRKHTRDPQERGRRWRWLTRRADGGGAIFRRVETHRGHISLDLAKQSEHQNFRYGAWASRSYSRAGSFTHTRRMTRERISRELAHERSFFRTPLPILSPSPRKDCAQFVGRDASSLETRFVTSTFSTLCTRVQLSGSFKYLTTKRHFVQIDAFAQ